MFQGVPFNLLGAIGISVKYLVVQMTAILFQIIIRLGIVIQIVILAITSHPVDGMGNLPFLCAGWVG